MAILSKAFLGMAMVKTGFLMLKGFLLVAFAALTTVGLEGCQSRTVVYTSPAPRSTTTYVRTPARVVTSTVHVKEEGHPTSLPGAPKRISDPGDPENFPAATNQ